MTPATPTRRGSLTGRTYNAVTPRAERSASRSAFNDKLEETRRFNLSKRKLLVQDDTDSEDDDEDEDEDEDNDVHKMLFCAAHGKENQPIERERDVIKPTDAYPTPKRTPSKKQSRLSAAVASASTSSLLPDIPSPRFTNIYTHAQALLAISDNSASSSLPFIGREKEVAIITKFLSNRFEGIYDDVPDAIDSTRPTLYISGPPGIGKTASLVSVLADFVKRSEKSESTVRIYMTNCSSMGSVGIEASMWDRLGEGLGFWNQASRGVEKGREGFANGLLQEDHKFLIVLDEIDHILTPSLSTSSSHRNLLNSLFSLAHLPDSSLTIIGIANALDLTTRSLHLNRLSSSSSSLNTPSPSPRKNKGKGKADGPILLHFKPYKAADIINIIQQRLSLVSDTYPLDRDSTPTKSAIVPLVNDRALELCARKVETATGDVRTALKIVGEAIRIVERAEIKRISGGVSPGSSSAPSTPTSTPTKSHFVDHLTHLTPATAVKAAFPQIIRALNFAGLQTPDTLATKLSELNFAARNALVGIVVALSRAGTGDACIVKLGEAYEVYREILKKDGTINPLSRAEFRGMVDIALEVGGFISTASGISSAKTKKQKKSHGSFNNAAADPFLSIPFPHTLALLSEALMTTPSISSDSTTSAGAMEETMRISINLLEAEKRRVFGSKRMKKFDELAPSAGFHGDGLDKSGSSWMGERKRNAEKEEE